MRSRNSNHTVHQSSWKRSLQLEPSPAELQSAVRDAIPLMPTNQRSRFTTPTINIKTSLMGLAPLGGASSAMAPPDGWV